MSDIRLIIVFLFLFLFTPVLAQDVITKKIKVEAIIKIEVEPSILIDTIQVTRRADVDGKLVPGLLDKVKGNGYFLAHEVNEMICFKTDSIINWQTKYNFKRTKSFGKISYENLNIPFQFIDVWFDPSTDTDTVINVKITEPYIHINSWLNGVQFKEFHRPNADGNNPFNFNISPLEKGKEYDFVMEVTNKKGKIIVYKTILKI